jgi:hydroxyacylglutathione hydrolase
MKIHVLPALKDNYIYVIEFLDKTACVVDPGDAAVVIKFCKSHQLNITQVLLTHHHWDHTDGAIELKIIYNCAVIGPREPTHPIKELTKTVSDGESILIGSDSESTMASIIGVPGHTLGQISYFLKQESALFVGDTLFGCGCGRLFEGTHEQMQNSLKKFLSLPDETKIYCGHEYTLNNLKFTEHLMFIASAHLAEYKHWADTQIKDHGRTIPLKLSLEKKCNPFLQNIALAEFQAIRERRNNW